MRPKGFGTNNKLDENETSADNNFRSNLKPSPNSFKNNATAPTSSSFKIPSSSSTINQYSSTSNSFKIPGSSDISNQSSSRPQSRPSSKKLLNGDADQQSYSPHKKQIVVPFSVQTSPKKQNVADDKSYSPKKKQAPPHPPFRTTLTEERMNEDIQHKEENRTNSSEENFSMKEMIKMRNGVSKQAIFKARQQNDHKSLQQNNIKISHQPSNVNDNNRYVDQSENEENIIENADDAKTTNQLSSSPDLHSSRKVENENVLEASSVSVSSVKEMFVNCSSTVEKIEEKATRPGRLPKRTLFQESFSVETPTISSPARPQGTPGKVSKSYFEQKQQKNSEMKTSQKIAGKWDTIQTVVNNNLRSSADTDLIIVDGDNNKESQNEKVMKHSSNSQSPLHSSRSRSSSQESSGLGYTLNRGESIYENEVVVNSEGVDSLKHSPLNHMASVKKIEEMPKENTVSSFRDIFQKKNDGANEKGKSHNVNVNVNVYDHPIKVSSARDHFQTPSSSSSTISFKNPPPRLSSVVDELFFHKMNSTMTSTSKPSQSPIARLQSAGLFFEPNKEENDKVVDVEENKPSTKEPMDSPILSEKKNGVELKRPRTPQDIWVASEEEFEKKVENEMDDKTNNTMDDDHDVDGIDVIFSNSLVDGVRFDDVTSRTHVLLMKQAQGTGDQMPVPIQMAQILGDKDQVFL